MKNDCSCNILRSIHKMEEEIRCILRLKRNSSSDCKRKKHRKCEIECENNKKDCGGFDKCDC